MERINFTNLPSTDTPVNANNLNTMQDNIEAEIQPLKENILSNNLFDGKLLTDKVHSSTGIITSAGITTNENYIKVGEGKTITVSANGKKLACTFLFYDASLNFLESVAGQVNATVPTGASYVAFNVATADLTGTEIMVNYGTEPMEYEKYVNAIAELEAEIGTKINKLVSVTKLNTAGWYRVAQWEGTKGVSFIVNVNTMYNSNNNMSTSLAINSAHLTAIIKQLNEKINGNRIISRARVVSEGNIQYLELYYSLATSNTVYVDMYNQRNLVTMLDFEAPTDTATVLNEITIATQIITTGTEFKTGGTIDGKEEYGKRINIGALPNATSASYAHGLSNVQFERIEGMTTGSTQVPINCPRQNAASSICAYRVGTNIVIETGTDRSAESANIIIYYTKNS